MTAGPTDTRSLELTLLMHNTYRWQVVTGVDRCRMSMTFLFTRVLHG